MLLYYKLSTQSPNTFNSFEDYSWRKAVRLPASSTHITLIASKVYNQLIIK
jgi:hypothetical protein